MKLHWGPLRYPAKVVFEYTKIYFYNKLKEQQVQTGARHYHISSLYGLSFGESSFIGIIRFSSAESETITKSVNETENREGP